MPKFVYVRTQVVLGQSQQWITLKFDWLTWERATAEVKRQLVGQALTDRLQFSFADPFPRPSYWAVAMNKVYSVLKRRHAPYSAKEGDTIPFVLHGRTHFIKTPTDLTDQEPIVICQEHGQPPTLLKAVEFNSFLPIEANHDQTRPETTD